MTHFATDGARKPIENRYKKEQALFIIREHVKLGSWEIAHSLILRQETFNSMYAILGS